MSILLDQFKLIAQQAKGYTAGLVAELAEAVEEAITPLEEHAGSAHAPASAEENVIVCVKKNGVAVAPVNKIVDIEVPTKLSDMTNDSGFATTQEVSSAINGSGHLKKAVVDALPAPSAADPDTIYYVRKNDGEAGEQYTEYQLINGAYELVGAKAVDLTPYAKLVDVAKADDALIESIVTNKTASSEAYIGAANLALFWSLIQPYLEGSDLTDLTARVRLLELVVLNEEISGNPFYVTFESLDGVDVSGVWNTQSERIEF